MVSALELSWVIPLAPVVAFLLIAAVGKRTPHQGGLIAIAGVALSLLLTLGAFRESFLYPEALPFKMEREWIPGTSLTYGVRADTLSLVMSLVVTTVGLAVVVYSLGYMRGDPGLRRYFAEISVFVGSMLGLVLASNYLMLFIFWELVGVCSYLLIGFWFEKPSAARAAVKAFVVTRFGDLFMLAGILLLFKQFGTLDFDSIFNAAQAQQADVTLAALLLFGGAVGKSAQVPLHTWLPDAMEGPTTVSALIHAATMVKAGVYLVARSMPLFLLAPDAMLVVAIIGAVTALLAASMGLVANDIKRVLAYSTVSQLGYMFLALGVGAYAAGMFHLLSHAYFKALLFLAAGSVIHAVGTNDLRLMGGLRKVMPVTSLAMLVGGLSLAGVPPFSGFWSKDEVLGAAWRAHPLLFAAGLLAALFTAFYIFRLWFMAFGKEFRGSAEKRERLHESPRVMTWVLVALMPPAALAFLWGFAGFGHYVGLAQEPYHLGHTHLYAPGKLMEEAILPPVAALSIAVAVGGLLLARAVYSRGKPSPEAFTATPARAALHRMLERKFGFDDAYGAVARGFVRLADGIHWTDLKVVDGVIHGIAGGTAGLGQKLRRLQSGMVQNYTTLVAVGAALLIILAWRFR
ncbi:MAG: NADH-quinone oxidoreductase subunit L [Halobacteria archaeon]